MVKQYVLVSNEQRLKLIKLVHEKGLTIAKAAILAKIYYPTAKAINKVYT